MRRSFRILLAVFSMTAMLVATSYAVSTEREADAAVRYDRVVFEDDFTGDGEVDLTKWTPETGGGGWGNNERQYYQNSTRNVRVRGGNLEITARKEGDDGRCAPGVIPCYTSGRLVTKDHFSQKYGRFEARIKVPRGIGLWPAFWMLGDGTRGWPYDGEIDIMEHVGREPHNIYGVVHGPGYSGGDGVKMIRTFPYKVGDGGSHTYAVEWSPGKIVWYIDQADWFELTPADVGGREWVFDKHPFYMILNMAVGGEFGGAVDPSLTFPQTMLVEYVRVFAPSTVRKPGRFPPKPRRDLPEKPRREIPPGPVGTLLRSKLSDRCIDVPVVADGTRLAMSGCHDSPARWDFQADYTVRTGGMCMDPAGGALTDGTPIQLVRCNTNPVQRFVVSEAGDLVNISADKCVEIVGFNAGDGALLQLARCSGGDNQKWKKS